MAAEADPVLTVAPMTQSDRSETTMILSQAVRGDAGAAERLAPLVYDSLRNIAAGYMSRERSDHTLQPTALVHEAYLRLVDRARVDWQGRTHFLAVAAKEMRRVLIHHARGRHAAKRGGGRARVSLEQALLQAPGGDVAVLDLEEALAELSALDPRQGRVVELRFFGGLTVEEVAQALSISPKTVEKDWRLARAWLYRRLAGRRGP
jgi:RNA polymerase sigma factor (TIGR02999 family)